MDTFRHMRKLHGAMELLVAAARLHLPPPAEARRAALLEALTPDEMTTARAAELATGPLLAEVSAFLRSLAGIAAKNPA